MRGSGEKPSWLMNKRPFAPVFIQFSMSGSGHPDSRIDCQSESHGLPLDRCHEQLRHRKPPANTSFWLFANSYLLSIFYSDPMTTYRIDFFVVVPSCTQLGKAGLPPGFQLLIFPDDTSCCCKRSKSRVQIFSAGSNFK
jgi:hypothetical protein